MNTDQVTENLGALILGVKSPRPEPPDGERTQDPFSRATSQMVPRIASPFGDLSIRRIRFGSSPSFPYLPSVQIPVCSTAVRSRSNPGLMILCTSSRCQSPHRIDRQDVMTCAWFPSRRHAEPGPVPCRSAPSVVEGLPLESCGDHIADCDDRAVPEPDTRPLRKPGPRQRNLTSKPKLDENMITAQNQEPDRVVANSVGSPGLDKRGPTPDEVGRGRVASAEISRSRSLTRLSRATRPVVIRPASAAPRGAVAGEPHLDQDQAF